MMTTRRAVILSLVFADACRRLTASLRAQPQPQSPSLDHSRELEMPSTIHAIRMLKRMRSPFVVRRGEIVYCDAITAHDLVHRGFAEWYR